MKILFVFYVPSGGLETLNRQRRAALKEHQCEFLYYRQERSLINDHGAPVYITNEDERIKQILDEGSYDLVVVTSDVGTMPRFRKLGYKGKFIYEIQGFGAKEYARRVLTHAKPMIVQHANGLLTPRTPYVMEIFNDLFPTIPKYNFNNCLDWPMYAYKPLPKHPRPIIGWIGRIEDNKNWSEFLKIGQKLIQDHPAIELYMFEDPTLSTTAEREKFQALIKELNVENHLTIFENVPNSEMRDYFSKIGDSGGFFCMTSKTEGAPYSPLEAMASRCPVLTTDCYGVRTAVTHNQTGKYYQIGNIDDAVKEAKELMSNLPLREKIRQQALTHVQTNFSLERYHMNFSIMLQSLGLGKK
ncbi:glycosyltransferase family 4 protein [Neobacillus sp. SM06]|uniref:glycosyltransferase family 4 protein n=1 Tax=Neobacillus sp. SM06 TaxID=3422492 RepID=UPI003D2B1DE3